MQDFGNMGAFVSFKTFEAFKEFRRNVTQNAGKEEVEETDGEDRNLKRRIRKLAEGDLLINNTKIKIFSYKLLSIKVRAYMKDFFKTLFGLK